MSPAYVRSIFDVSSSAFSSQEGFAFRHPQGVLVLSFRLSTFQVSQAAVLGDMTFSLATGLGQN